MSIETKKEEDFKNLKQNILELVGEFEERGWTVRTLEIACKSLSFSNENHLVPFEPHGSAFGALTKHLQSRNTPYNSYKTVQNLKAYMWALEALAEDKLPKEA